MAVTDLSMLKALRTKMQWHQARQVVLAENVANAETPGYRARDLVALDFAHMLPRDGDLKTLRPAATQAGHIPGLGMADPLRPQTAPSFEVTPDGNAVVLEEQMMEVAANQLDYQAATSLYTRGIGMLKLALGRRG